MLYRQKKTHNALRAIQLFLDAHHDRLYAVNEGGARATLDKSIEELEALCSQQDPTRIQRSSEREAERRARADLLNVHMKPITRIARAELRDAAEFAQLRLPDRGVDVPAVVVWAKEMAKAASALAATFIGWGLAPDFAEKLVAAGQVLERAHDARVAAHARRLGATARMQTEASRAYAVIGVIDSLVVPQLGGDAQLIKEWQSTKRIGNRSRVRASGEVARVAESDAVRSASPETVVVRVSDAVPARAIALLPAASMLPVVLPVRERVAVTGDAPGSAWRRFLRLAARMPKEDDEG